MEEIVERLLKERIDDMDIGYLVKEIIRSLVSTEVKVAIKPIIEIELTSILKEEIKTVLATEVKTDDGWGNKAAYSNFETLFKSEFKKKLSDTYKIQSIIKTLVEERVKSLIDQDYAKVVETIVDTLTASKLVKR